jgi:hypothetical protein
MDIPEHDTIPAPPPDMDEKEEKRVEKVIRQQDFSLGANQRYLTLPGGLPRPERKPKQ